MFLGPILVKCSPTVSDVIPGYRKNYIAKLAKQASV